MILYLFKIDLMFNKLIFILWLLSNIDLLHNSNKDNVHN